MHMVGVIVDPSKISGHCRALRDVMFTRISPVAPVLGGERLGVRGALGHALGRGLDWQTVSQ